MTEGGLEVGTCRWSGVKSSQGPRDRATFQSFRHRLPLFSFLLISAKQVQTPVNSQQVRQSQQVHRVIQDYGTKICLLRERNTLLSVTLDNKTRSLGAAQIDKDAWHQQAADVRAV